jgi:hypothetical protein
MAAFSRRTASWVKDAFAANKGRVDCSHPSSGLGVDSISKEVLGGHRSADCHAGTGLSRPGEPKAGTTGSPWRADYPQRQGQRGHFFSRAQRQSLEWRCRQIKLGEQRLREKKSGLRWCHQCLQGSSATPHELADWGIRLDPIEVEPTTR